MNERLYYTDRRNFPALKKMRNPKGSQKDAPVTVTFPIPRRAASKLRTMAVSRDRRLLDLGVLAVQINEGESIVLGIKLGKQRIKNTEVGSEKVRGNANRGRVKKPSTCRNVATIHHMPNVFNSQAPHKLQATQAADFGLENGEERRMAQLDGRGGNDLFDGFSKTVGKSTNNSCKSRLSDFTTSRTSDLSLNELLSSAKLSAHQTNKPPNNSNYALDGDFISRGSNMQKTMGKPSISPAMVTSRKAGVESYLSAVQTLSSPASQRPYSASPSSDTSSASSEENFDVNHDQLIYSCFVDKSKYCAADMLKELAKTHATKKNTTSTPHVANKVPHAVKTSMSTAKSSSDGNFLFQRSRSLDNSERSNISGSYRDHVKNIRCNSLTSLTTSTSTVNATLRAPAASTDQTIGFQNDGNISEKPSAFEDRTQSQLSQHTFQHTALSKLSIETVSQTRSIKRNTSKTTTYHGGRKVLWSSSNAFPRSTTTSLAHLPINNSNNAAFPLNSASSSNVEEASASSSCTNSNAATFNDDIKSTPVVTHSSIPESNKPAEQEWVNETNATHSDSKPVITRTPSLSFDFQDSVTAQTTGPHITAFTSSSCIPQATNSVKTESANTAVIQNLTMGRPTVPAPVVVGGTNTQTTWSNQQVSPTYFVGAQGQYGIYSALYSPDVNNNQLGQQPLTPAYPLNYVYPVSFVYPYLAMAQANNMKSTNSEPQNGNKEVTQTDAYIDWTKIAKTETCVDAKELIGTTTNLLPTTSSTAPSQTQFIDLASSMRYWQQVGQLLYRSRLQALASCNLSNVGVSTVSSSQQVNTAVTATSTLKSTESQVTVANDEPAAKSSSEELSFFRLEVSQANASKDFHPEKTQSNDFAKENVCSELLQHIKPEINLEEESVLKDITASDRPSVIVAASCQDKWDCANETLTSPVKFPCTSNQDESDVSGTKSSESVSCRTSVKEEAVCSAKLLHDRLRHFDEDNMEGSVAAGLKRSFSDTPPKLSFIHDSSIACVNVGSSNGNGFGSSTGSYAGIRRTGGIITTTKVQLKLFTGEQRICKMVAMDDF